MNKATLCTMDGCEKLYNCRGYCKYHYMQSYYGKLPKGETLVENPKTKYDRRIDKTGDCWVWLGSRDKRGYGRINNGKGKWKLAHRIIYELYVGKIPEGLVLDHLCMNQPCVNPEHLEPVTQTENIRRAYAIKPIVCPQGHPYDNDNTYVNPLGKKICRICTRMSGRRYRERLKVAK